MHYRTTEIWERQRFTICGITIRFEREIAYVEGIYGARQENLEGTQRRSIKKIWEVAAKYGKWYGNLIADCQNLGVAGKYGIRHGEKI